MVLRGYLVFEVALLLLKNIDKSFDLLYNYYRSYSFINKRKDV